jgi:DNA repair exonuclease SbcCD ATPase subunit
MSRGGRIDNVKSRVADLKVAIEEAEEREANAKAELLSATERQIKNETEARSLRNRLKTLRDEMGRVTGRKSDILNQLDENAQRSEQSESNRKRLAEKEEEDFERSQEIEEAAKQIKYDLEEKENRHKEATLREKALVIDLKRTEEKLKRFLAKEDEFAKQLHDITGSTQSLEDNVNVLNEKEDELQEKIAFLDDQFKQVSILCDEKTAKIKTSERMRDRLRGEIKREEEKIAEIEKQFAEIEGEEATFA